MHDIERFQRTCRLLRTLLSCCLAGMGALLSCCLIGMGVLFAISSMTHVGTTELRPWLLALVRWMPAFGYLWALLAAHAALGKLAHGQQLFHATLSRALRHMGWGVVVGSLLTIFAVTNLERLIRHGQGSYAWFNLSAMALFAVGVTLLLLARLIEHARSLEQELEEIL